MNSFDGFKTRRDVEELFGSSRFNGDPESVESTGAFLRGGFEPVVVKHNPKRKVLRLANAAGRELYLKLFAHQKFPFNIVRYYASKEYSIAKELEKAGVPIVKYLVWGKAENRCGFCFSEGVPGAIPARRFFFETALADPAVKKHFLGSVNAIVHFLHEKQFLHPDFYTGNVICDPAGDKLRLVDPWGVRETFFRTGEANLALCGIWMELRGYISDDEILSGMMSSGLVKNKMSALELIEKAKLRYDRCRAKQRPKLFRRILNGHYKYTTVETRPDGKYYWRHNLWFAPPETFEIDPAWEKVLFPSAADAEKHFLESFDRLNIAILPRLFIARTDGSGELYFANNSLLEKVRASARVETVHGLNGKEHADV